MSPHPDDRCPFTRPFRDDFSECAGFDPATFTQPPLTRYSQVRPIATCSHLQLGRLPGGTYYPRCDAGGAAVFAPKAHSNDEAASETA